MTTKQVSKKEKKAPNLPAAHVPDVASPHIGSDDLMIAKILPIHYMSKKATGKGKTADPGEFRDSVENRLFGGLDKPFDFVPVHMISYFAEYEVQGADQRKYLGSVPITAANENLPREEVIGGKKISRMKTYEVFLLLPEEVKAGTAFPYVLAFRSASLRAGKTLLTQMYVRNRHARQLPYQVVCEVSLTEASNDKGEYFVMGVKPKRPATAEEIEAAQHWSAIITSGTIKKDDSDLEVADTDTAAMKDVNSEAF